MCDVDMEEAGQAPVSLDEVMALQGDEAALRAKIKEILAENQKLRQKIAALEEEKQQEQDSLVFQIDTEPQGDAEVTEVYLHDPKRDGQPLQEGQGDQPEVKVSSGPRSTCWNCDGGHGLSECPDPRDYQKIAKMRKEFMKNQPANKARYHLDEPQMFGHLTPGIPSTKLREALGLKADQLPSYIYRLREMGYPPGWLKEAEIRTSGVALYVAAGKSLGSHGDEDGEVVEEGDKTEYDVDKLASWPGFNVPLEGDFRDEANFYGVPPIQPAQALEEMLKELKPKSQKGYVRGEMQDTRVAEDDADSPESPPPGTEDKVEVEVQKEERSALLSDEVKVVNEGTPIVSVYSPFNQLPKQDNWTCGTTDHILFENLPDSTGKWDQMLGVIKKTRDLRKNMVDASKK